MDMVTTPYFRNVVNDHCIKEFGACAVNPQMRAIVIEAFKLKVGL